MLKESPAYFAFCQVLGVAYLAPLIVCTDGAGDVFGVLYQHPNPRGEGERWGLLAYCLGSALGPCEPLWEVGSDFAEDLTPRRKLKAAMLNAVSWYSSEAALVEDLNGPPLGLAVLAPSSSWRAFRELVLFQFEAYASRRWLLGFDGSRLIEYEASNAPSCYKLTPAVAHFGAFMSQATRMQLARLQAERLPKPPPEPRAAKGEAKHKPPPVYTWGLSAQHDQLVEEVERRAWEIALVAAEEFTPAQLAAASWHNGNDWGGCLVEAKEAVELEALLAEREEERASNDSNTPSAHYPYKSKGMPEGAAMRPDLRLAK